MFEWAYVAEEDQTESECLCSWMDEWMESFNTVYSEITQAVSIVLMTTKH